MKRHQKESAQGQQRKSKITLDKGGMLRRRGKWGFGWI